VTAKRRIATDPDGLDLRVSAGAGEGKLSLFASVGGDPFPLEYTRNAERASGAGLSELPAWHIVTVAEEFPCVLRVPRAAYPAPLSKTVAPTLWRCGGHLS